MTDASGGGQSRRVAARGVTVVTRGSAAGGSLLRVARLHPRLLASLTLAAAAFAVLGGLAGIGELALHLAPFALVVGLLLRGRFVGEAQVLRRRERRPLAVAARRERCGWPPHPDVVVRGLLERSPVCRRGPPVASATLCA